MSKGLYQLYLRAGPKLVARSLERVFKKIENDEDRILHNDAMADMAEITRGQEDNVFRALTELILYPRKTRYPRKRKKRLLFRMAEEILEIARFNNKGQ